MPDRKPAAIVAATVASQPGRTVYPPPYAALVAGRDKKALGDQFGLANFGVNLTRLAPGARSALRHAHTRQDEFVYIIEGAPVLVDDSGETPLRPGMCAGFKAGGAAHHLVNRSDADVIYLEIGDRSPGDAVTYPDDDLVLAPSPDGATRQALHKDGTPW